MEKNRLQTKEDSTDETSWRRNDIVNRKIFMYYLFIYRNIHHSLLICTYNILLQNSASL